MLGVGMMLHGGLTVLFSTFNGVSSLPHMLDAFERLETPAGGWKIVAINNASTDNTAALLEQRAARLPLTILAEPRQGKNYSLNTGLVAAEGDLVVLTDDDVIPCVDWLVAMRHVADEQLDYDIFSGAIHPIWPEAPPDWMLRCVPKGHFAWTDFAEGPAAPWQIWGPNMAVRSKVFSDHRFFEGIGPNGGPCYATGSETEFAARAARAEHLCWHTHGAVVGHMIEPQQMTAEWLLQRSYNQARGERRLIEASGEDHARTFFRYPPALRRQYAKAVIRVAVTRLFGGFEDRFMARRVLRELEGDLAARRDRLRARAASGQMSRAGYGNMYAL
jgi:glycosyltransferase involved in cell wall biosynthesis